jgi:hypothetical protein
MIITFRCGSLAYGQDGVGDYTRRLAAELIRQGHQASIIALNDRLIDSMITTTEEVDEITIPILRLSAKMPNKERFAYAAEFIVEFNPEWLSLQYVPFSFQDKGLPFGLDSQLGEIGKGRKWHVMFHELWVGMNNEASLKLKVWGKIQQLITQNILQRLKPIVIHTQTRLYQAQLSKLGYETVYLPLFGNIAVSNKQNQKKDLVTDKKKLSFVVFGSIHYGAPITEFAKQAKVYSINNQLAIEISFIGRCGEEQENWVRICNQEGLTVKVYGEQSVEKISEILHQADIGITTTPLLLTEKSGTVAAMLEHDLPVLCVARRWTVKGFTENSLPTGVHLFNNEYLSKYISTNSKKNSYNFVSKVSSQFIELLTKK